MAEDILSAAEIAELRVEPGDKECGYYEIPCDQAARIFITLDARDAEIAALREIVAAVATSNPYGSWYPANSGPAGVVCRWCMERALTPQDCQHDAECHFARARILVGEK